MEEGSAALVEPFVLADEGGAYLAGGRLAVFAFGGGGVGLAAVGAAAGDGGAGRRGGPAFDPERLAQGRGGFGAVGFGDGEPARGGEDVGGPAAVRGAAAGFPRGVFGEVAEEVGEAGADVGEGGLAEARLKLREALGESAGVTRRGGQSGEDGFDFLQPGLREAGRERVFFSGASRARRVARAACCLASSLYRRPAAASFSTAGRSASPTRFQHSLPSWSR